MQYDVVQQASTGSFYNQCLSLLSSLFPSAKLADMQLLVAAWHVPCAKPTSST